MEIQRPNAGELTPEEAKELEKVKAVIERAIADGKLTSAEIQTIRTAIWADKKVSVEELNLVTTLIREKMERGELSQDWW
ncbi:hypothetical protein [Fischerella sp. PCC 9605]|uniref:hypothetical protein n=1 Tax=Fischerella sp. PCC 9605 TaxID=1173024 RepID=UPI000478C6A5|nr:hypothetical protein [Fischerella sp. PCC 9605]